MRTALTGASAHSRLDDREQHEADQEHAPPGMHIAVAPRRHEHEAEGKSVAGDDELHFARPGTKGVLDCGNADVDLRQVENGEGCDGNTRGESLPLRTVRRIGFKHPAQPNSLVTL